MSGLGSFTSAIATIAQNKGYIVLGAAAAAALAGATLSQINSQTGHSFQNNGTRQSMSVASVGDPNVRSYIDGTETGLTTDDSGFSNFITAKNTVGGPTQVSTSTTRGAYNHYYNSTVTISGPGWECYGKRSLRIVTENDSRDRRSWHAHAQSGSIANGIQRYYAFRQ
jgi:hypothetical protein